MAKYKHTQTDGHPHHFVLAPPGNKTSMGRCKLCGLKREHTNILPFMDADFKSKGKGAVSSPWWDGHSYKDRRGDLLFS